MLSVDYSSQEDDVALNFTYEIQEMTIRMEISGDSVYNYKPNEWRELADQDKILGFGDNDGTAAVNGCTVIFSKFDTLNFVVDGSLGGVLRVSIPKTDQVIELLYQIADELEKYPNPFKNITPSENHEFMPYE